MVTIRCTWDELRELVTTLRPVEVEPPHQNGDGSILVELRISADQLAVLNDMAKRGRFVASNAIIEFADDCLEQIYSQQPQLQRLT